MAIITTGLTIREVNRVGGKHLEVFTAATADSDDTFVIDLATYGGAVLKGVYGWIHSTLHSIIIQEDPTTVMSGTELTATVKGSSADDQARFYKIMFW